MNRRCVLFPILVATIALSKGALAVGAEPTAAEILQGMQRATNFYRENFALKGGYVYYYSQDATIRLGEGVATPTQIWVQPPGTPTVGMAYVTAFNATENPLFLDAAVETAEALLHGQLESGGWANMIDFDPAGKRVGRYRGGRGHRKGRNYSTLDDNATQSALRFLMAADEALQFRHKGIHEAVEYGLNALMNAQFPNGGFPQVWDAPVAKHPVMAAQFPDYDYRTDNRIKEYWNLYTLNDGLAGDVAEVLIDAERIYKQPRYKEALKKLGDFLILAQLPAPQPAWAQQYDYKMRPVWARKFEPAAITGGESQDAISALMTIYEHTGDARYLEPIPPAIAYLESSKLPDGRLARFYELQTNRPLYMTKDYKLTYDDSQVPTHYGFKISAKLERLQERYNKLKQNGPPKPFSEPRGSAREAGRILEQLSEQGGWLTTADGSTRLVGQPKFRAGDKYLSSAVFSENLTRLARAYRSLQQN